MRKRLSTPSFAVIALLATAVPCLAQVGQDQTRQIAAPTSELALAYSAESPVNLPDSGREKGLEKVLPGVRTAPGLVAGRNWDELSDEEKGRFGSQLKAETSQRSLFGAGGQAGLGGRSDATSGKSLEFVYRARQPYGR